MKVTDIHWLAGLLEGEGCFTTHGGSKPGAIRIVVAMTDEDVIRRAHLSAGVGWVTGPYLPPGSKNKPQWRWVVARSADAAGLMMTLYPLLGARRQERIRELIDVWRRTPRIRRSPPRLVAA